MKNKISRKRNQLPRLFVLGSILLLSGCERGEDTDLREVRFEPDPLDVAMAPHDGEDLFDREIQRAQARVERGTFPLAAMERLGWACISKARASFDNGYYLLAEACADAIEVMDPEADEALLLRGHIFNNIHRFAEAEKIALALVERRGLASDYLLLADALTEQGKLGDAIAVYQVGVDMKPDLQSYARVGWMRWLIGDLSGAIEATERAVKASSPLDPESRLWVMTRLADLLFLDGQNDKAGLVVQAALRSQEEFAPALLLKGRMQMAEEDLASAVETLERAVERNPMPDYRWALAEAYRYAGRIEDALAMEESIEKFAPRTDPRTYSFYLATRGKEIGLAVRQGLPALDLRRGRTRSRVRRGFRSFRRSKNRFQAGAEHRKRRRLCCEYRGCRGQSAARRASHPRRKSRNELTRLDLNVAVAASVEKFSIGVCLSSRNSGNSGEHAGGGNPILRTNDGVGDAMNRIPRLGFDVFVSTNSAVFFLLFATVAAFSSEVATIPPDGADGPEGIPPLAMKYCTACHLPPRPNSLPKRLWPIAFDYMAKWTRETQLPFDETEYEELLDYYITKSPEKFEPVPDDLPESSLTFQRTSVGLPAGERPRITHVNLTDLDRDGRDDVLVCDDVSDRVSWLRIEGGKWNEIPLVSIPAPSKTAILDFDGDGRNDILVASLGEINPTDARVGSAWLMMNRGDGSFESLNLLKGVARVADIKPGDFDGNGTIDFVVAMFGWRVTGGVMILEQETETRFRSREITDLHGAMQVEVVDFDEDGLDDLVVLFTQEHENIVLFRNGGSAGFIPRILARAPHPAFGSSGFELVDLDGDGDLDIIYTNGDMMDEISVPKPYHGVRWFENIDGDFHTRDLARMTGCYRAVAHDMNGDGHLDIVVSSLNFYWDESDLPSVIWLENDGEQNFTAQWIAYAPTNLATMDVGDLNHDGLPDIVAGGMHVPGPLGRVGRLTVFFQQESPENEEPDAGSSR